MLGPESDLSTSGLDHSSKVAKDLAEANLTLDSGFISETNAAYSREFDSALDDDTKSQPKEKHQKQSQIDTNIDSGVIEDHEFPSESNQSSHMILRGSGSDVGLPDWFNNLSLKDSPSINNLDGRKEKSNSQQKSTDLQANELWKLCFRQDAEGDT